MEIHDNDVRQYVLLAASVMSMSNDAPGELCYSRSASQLNVTA